MVIVIISLCPVDGLTDQIPVDVIHDHSQNGRCDEDRYKAFLQHFVDALLVVRIEHADGEHEDRVVPPFALEPVGHDSCICVAGEKADRHHYKDHNGHDDYACKRLFDLRENDPEDHIQYHDLDSKPHLVVDQENAEEAAYDFSESEVPADDDIVYQCIGQIDVIADEERNEDREDPSLHEAFYIVLVSHPALQKTEA